MGRYIDADKLVQMYERAIEDEWNKKTAPSSWAAAYDCVIADIDDHPTADVVEVVRCKDCKHCEDLIMGGLWCNHPDNRNPLGCRPNDYCNDGERREG